jgi:DNA-binding protein HU-beta
MNKGDLVAAVADKTDITKSQAAAAVDAVLDAITATLKKGEEVRLVGFGTFAVSKRPAGTARNPRTGETIKTAASIAPKFKAGAGLKAAVNGK